MEYTSSIESPHLEKNENDAQYSPPLTLEEQHARIEELAQEYGVDHRKLMWKCDWIIVPPICLLYLLAFLDRVNIGNANVYGLAKDLKLQGSQYNTALTIFFVPYILAEVPSNYFLKKTRPRYWLAGCMIVFGVVSIAQGFVKNFGGLMTTRFFLGMAEAGMFPGCFYLIAMWYRRDEAQKRYSFFFSSTTLAGAFSGLIAAGIYHLEGKRGIAGWRWIFIIEGAITVVFSAILLFVISDFPEDAKFLSENERKFLKAKLSLDVGDSSHDVPLTFRRILNVFKEWKIYVASLMYFSLVIGAYGYAYFAPTIISSLTKLLKGGEHSASYLQLQAQFYSVPPWVCACGMSMVVAAFSDYFCNRFFFGILTCLISMAGFIMLMADHHNVHVRYGGLFLIVSGLYTAMPVLVCWTQMNFGGHHRRSVATAFQVGFGNIGGIVATYTFIAKDAPFYTKGLGVGLAFAGFCAVLVCVYFLGIRYENHNKQSPKNMEKWEKLSPLDKKVAGDLAPSYRYSY